MTFHLQGTITLESNNFHAATLQQAIDDWKKDLESRFGLEVQNVTVVVAGQEELE